MVTRPEFLAPISQSIWQSKYRFVGLDGQGDASVADTFRRVAEAAAKAEPGSAKERKAWAQRFYDAMADYRFLPAGRILAGAGTDRSVTLINCFVMGQVADDLGDIFDRVKDAALTMQLGGGIGQDFSTLRPEGAEVRRAGSAASGPVSFMDVWDSMCRSIMSSGARRGAMMGTLRVDHPDIEQFIDAKADPARLRNFNVSVLVTDAFMKAVKDDAPWDLVFEGKVYRTVSARSLWQRLLRASYDYAEPGVIFIDRINAQNNLSYCENIYTTNPCGEQPLPPNGACVLGSLNLTRFVDRPFADDAAFDVDGLAEHAALAVRFLDNIIDVSPYPLDAQREEAQAKRRVGLGITGLADALALLGIRYGTVEAASLASFWMGVIKNAAYLESAELAKVRGAFPLYDADPFLQSPNVTSLAPETRAAIKMHGIRNGCLTSIAPTGTISLFAGNVSSGVEPIFDFSYQRRVLDVEGETRDERVEDYACALYAKTFGENVPLTDAFVRSADLGPDEHLLMQAALQHHVDSSISKTINCPEDMPFSAFEHVYDDAYGLGLKGCTVYRPNNVTGAVLVSAADDAVGSRDALVAGAGSAQDDARPDDGARIDVVPGDVDVAAADAQSTHDDRTRDRVPRVDEQAKVPGGRGHVSGSAQSVAAVADGDAGTTEADVVYMSKPLERGSVLRGLTYKLDWPGSDHAYYITINDIEVAGRRRPYEIFINSRNLEQSAWTTALTRMISAVFRRGGDVAFISEELRAIFDTDGGRWVGGRFVPSLLAAIGDIIDAHLRRIGFSSGGLEDAGVAYVSGPATPLQPQGDQEEWRVAASYAVGEAAGLTNLPVGSSDGDVLHPAAVHIAAVDGQAASGLFLGGPSMSATADGVRSDASRDQWRDFGHVRICPQCSSASFVHESGCGLCRSCGYSRCE